MNGEDLDKIFDTLEEVASYVDGCDDWVTVKKQVLLNLPPRLRKAFSTRDSKTKEHDETSGKYWYLGHLEKDYEPCADWTKFGFAPIEEDEE